MKVTHTFNLTAKCPNGGETYYRVSLKIQHFAGNKVLEVENIDTFVKELIKEPVFQEDLTLRLAKFFNADVVSTGQHSNFTTHCETDANDLG